MTQDPSPSQPKPEPAPGSVSIHIGGDAKNSQIIGAGGDVLVEGGMQTASTRVDLSTAFAAIYQQIEARPVDPRVDKAEVKQTVEKIEAEAKKGEKADAPSVEMRFRMLAAMAPDVAEVVAATLISPLAAVGTIIRKVAEKAKAELAAKSADKKE